MAVYGLHQKRSKRRGGARDESEVYISYDIDELMDLLRRTDFQCKKFIREQKVRKRRQSQNSHENE